MISRFYFSMLVISNLIDLLFLFVFVGEIEVSRAEQLEGFLLCLILSTSVLENRIIKLYKGWRDVAVRRNLIAFLWTDFNKNEIYSPLLKTKSKKYHYIVSSTILYHIPPKGKLTAQHQKWLSRVSYKICRANCARRVIW